MMRPSHAWMLLAFVATWRSYTTLAEDPVISTVTTGGRPIGVAVDVSSDFIYVIDTTGANGIQRVNLTSKQHVSLSLSPIPTEPIGAHVDVSGSLYYTDSKRHVVYKYSWANNVRSPLPNYLAPIAGEDGSSGFAGDGEPALR